MLDWKGFLPKSLLASGLLWTAFPPWGWWPMGLVAVAIYLSMVLETQPWSKRKYGLAWVGSALTWLALLQGIRLAYWPLYFGWIALSLYLAVYLLLFLAIARTLVHRWGWPLLVAAPLSWMSSELIRGYLLTGFSGCLLGHSLSRVPWLTQVASQSGTYGVSGLWVLLACLSLSVWHRWKPVTTLRFSSPGWEAAGWLTIGLWLAYGAWELHRSPSPQDHAPLLTVALIQENAPTMFEANEYRNIAAWNSYLEQTRQAIRQEPNIDLLVWPESIFTRNEPYFDWDGSQPLPPSLQADGIDHPYLTQVVNSLKLANQLKMEELARAAGQPDTPVACSFLVGGDVHRIRGPSYERLNAALWISPKTQVEKYYAKQHLVMFGEYIPLGDWLPFIYRWIGMQPASPGKEAVCFQLEKADRRLNLSPSICFENMVPQFLRRQLRSCQAQGHPIDAMINITNDGWFHGSSISDIHLNNAILAAVENRKPMMIAANTGLTAWIDGSGRLQSLARRLEGACVIAKPIADGRLGLWSLLGDWPVRLVTVVCLSLWLWPYPWRKQLEESPRMRDEHQAPSSMA